MFAHHYILSKSKSENKQIKGLVSFLTSQQNEKMKLSVWLGEITTGIIIWLEFWLYLSFPFQEMQFALLLKQVTT